MGGRVLAAEAALALALIAAAFAAGVTAWRAPSPHPPATVVVEPGGRPADVALALSDPDAYAWRLFFFLNRPALPGAAGVADPARGIRNYAPDTPVVWETWALVSGEGGAQNSSEVLRPGGIDPGAWAKLPRAPQPPKTLSVRLADPTGPANLEVRVNQAAFELIRAQDLYAPAGLSRLYASARAAGRPDFLQFPPAAKAVKAQWKDLGQTPSAAQLARYHWRRIGGRYWGLEALHIATRDLPTWFWADFEHVDDPIPPGEPSSDTTTRGPGAAFRDAVDGERRELAGTKWAYYRLRGTQIAYADARGIPTRLSDAALEQRFEHTSCISCHARATVRVDAQGLTALQPNPAHFDDAAGRRPAIPDRMNADLGPPSPALFGKNGLDYIQTDFVWSMIVRVPRETPGGRLVPR